MNHQSIKPNFLLLREVANGIWNYATSLLFLGGLVDVGTHMSISKLSSGKFLIIDTCDPIPELKREIDELTNNGDLIEAVIATHPFHTLYFPAFYQNYPNAKYFGTPRHLKIQPNIPWAGSINDESILRKFEPDVYMRIPDGADFITPAENNHFSSVIVLHAPSRTVHDDDTICYFESPGCVLRCLGIRAGSMSFHSSMARGIGLYPTEEAPYQFRKFIEDLLRDWDFDNICTAHKGVLIGNAKARLQQTLNDAEPLFQKLSNDHKK